MVLKEGMDKKPQKTGIEKFAILSQPWNLTFFEIEIFQLFSCLYDFTMEKVQKLMEKS